ncbi:MAG: bifunctional phosphoribosylaminoimidazolecarboxamide formyltransferase/IMP cyclohydrolase [Prolixibacteraceae bacterium]|nr:bifunctional phosphoribosylaminoimidazolecarboxamide formyltransferase/IMP cyclohydrolase [Prolixibacteraceae bacterium]MBN2649987.1 bifunctional phosphoribosylaminoimidazolecarboxamide formyltransferase/IMP cyclohydrolase [Prolixibacteraceae bacterium]
MANSKKIKSALISVFHKERVDEIVEKLEKAGVKIYSTGGTQKFIEGLGVAVTPVEELTSYPSILGGRVKTLHPKVFGGILARRDNPGDIEQLASYEIPEIDLVVVDLYPFEDTVASGASHADIIEKIDIGGIALIRAAAKNYSDVIIVPSRNEYDDLLEILDKQNAESTLEQREAFAVKAFATSSNYDSAIFNYFDKGQSGLFRAAFNNNIALRYGENPHQKGVFYGNFDAMFEKVHGKEISYNNLLDIDAAVALIDEFDETTFAILKHNNACGCASRNKLSDAWKAALAGDPVSAFGGILITNKEVDAETASDINKLFFEVIIAPAYAPEAMELLQSKKNRIILIRKKIEMPKVQYRTVLNGVLCQDRDTVQEQANDLKPATSLIPEADKVEDLLFANRLVKQSKSNTIVLAKNKQLLASGVGETSRVDALKHAIEKAESFGFDLKGAVMSSDAFFPFADCVEIAHGVGIDCVVQPGGSIRDQDSIDYCNDHNMSMVFTGTRHFKH